jgi:pimeloyl-ACP methyl ester carboxylesterase
MLLNFVQSHGEVTLAVIFAICTFLGDCAKLISKVQVPTLILCGSEDHFFLSHKAHLHSLIPHSTACLVPKAGHGLLLENPIFVIKTIDRFWKNFPEILPRHQVEQKTGLLAP